MPAKPSHSLTQAPNVMSESETFYSSVSIIAVAAIALGLVHLDPQVTISQESAGRVL